MLRPEPLARPSVSLSRMVGRPVCSTTRAATMPITPACQSGDDSTTAAGSRSGSRARASRRMTASISWRSAFSAPRRWASGRAAARSGAPSSSTTCEASSRRPAAFRRGARRKPMVAASTSSGRVSLTSSRAARPGRGALRRRPMPMAARLRFSSSSGTTSATVPTATTSRYGPQGERQLDAVVATVFEQRVGQLEGHADAGQVRERVAAQLGVDDDALRELADRFVMVGDDHVEAQRRERVRPRRGRRSRSRR